MRSRKKPEAESSRSHPQQKIYFLHFKKSFDRHPKHTFSAFWLRSSVVSVLISLISGTWRMASHEFQ